MRGRVEGVWRGRVEGVWRGRVEGVWRGGGLRGWTGWWRGGGLRGWTGWWRGLQEEVMWVVWAFTGHSFNITPSKFAPL